MWVSCILRFGLFFVILFFVVVKYKLVVIFKSCYLWGILFGVVDMLCVKAAWFKVIILVSIRFCLE